MKLLYAPWRTQYSQQANGPTPTSTCVFCEQTASQDSTELKKYMILVHTGSAVVMMNKYPYNAGHTLVIPVAHKAELFELDTSVQSELMSLTSQACYVTKKQLACDALNVGINLGKASGGSLPEHLHIHVIPRWVGDTNFLVTTTDTKVISYDLETIYQKLLQGF